MFAFKLSVLDYRGHHDCLVDKDILRSKFSFAAFVARYVLKRSFVAASKIHQPETRSLFPKLEDAEIINLNNTIRGTAKVCAADDLELSFTGGYDDIDFLDASYPLNPRIDQFDERPHFSPHGHMPMLPASNWDEQSKLDHLAYSQYAPPSVISSQTLSYLSSLPLESGSNMLHNSASKAPAPLVQIQSQPLPQSYFQQEELATQSHFALNMIGLNTHFAFNDFGYSHHLDSLPLYTSSSESNASPLDEMFLKGTEDLKTPRNPSLTFIPQKNLKRKFNDFSPSSTSSEPQTAELFSLEPITHERTSSFAGAKKVKVEGFDISLGQALETDIQLSGDEELKYKCDQCESKFKVKSYLTRHRRKHNKANAFVCPFFETDDKPHEAKNGTRCHHTGGFSRRDTYKTHLKALHFIYPPGTKSSDRNSIGGRCAGCFDFFESNAKWLKFHIEGNQCKGIVGKNDTVAVKQEEIKQELENF